MSCIHDAFEIFLVACADMHCFVVPYCLQLDMVGHGKNEGKTIKDPEMLEAVMEFREAVAETDDPEELQKLKDNVDNKIEECIASLDGAFKLDDYAAASEGATALRYLTRIQEAIVHKL